MVSFDQEQGISPAEFEQAISSQRPVLRWIYHCAGIHDRVVDDSQDAAVELPREADEEESDTEEEGTGQGGENVEQVDEDADGDTDEEEYADGETRSRWKRCSDGVKLRVSGLHYPNDAGLASLTTTAGSDCGRSCNSPYMDASLSSGGHQITVQVPPTFASYTADGIGTPPGGGGQGVNRKEG